MLAGFARTPGIYVAVVSGWYFLNGLSGPAYAAIVRSNYSDANRGRLLGYIRIVITLIAALASAAAGAVLDLHADAYRVLLPAGALFGVVNALLFRRIRVRSERTASNPAVSGSLRSTLSRIRADRPFLAFLALAFLASGPDKLGIALEPILLVDEIGIDYRSAGLIFGTLASAVNILGFWLVGRLVKTRPFPRAAVEGVRPPRVPVGGAGAGDPGPAPPARGHPLGADEPGHSSWSRCSRSWSSRPGPSFRPTWARITRCSACGGWSCPPWERSSSNGACSACARCCG